MKRNSVIIKIFAVIMVMLAVFPMLVSCKKRERAVVGTVNGREVCYDELYFLVNSYKDSILESCNGDEALARQKLYELVMEDIVANCAILELCADYGLELDSVKSEVEDQVALTITQEFAYDEKAYRDSLKANNITEHYYEFVTGVDILYSKLPAKYEESGKISVDEDNIIDFVKNNFIRVNRIVRINETDDMDEDNLAKMEEALALLNAGYSMTYLIEHNYTHDYKDVSAKGYILTRGEMREDYEAAAFALEVGEISGIIKSRCESNLENKYVDCYYIIERLDLSDEYIEDNFYELKTKYINAIIASDLEAKRETLEFVPNEEFYKLDLLNLPQPRKSLTVFGLIMIIVGSVALVAVIVIMIIRKHSLKKKNIHAVAKKKRK